MNSRKALSLSINIAAASTALLQGKATAATVTIDQTWIVSTIIPDNNSSGLVDARNVTMGISSIDIVTITLNTSAGWNGDLYCYLQHDSGFTVLLNRPGRTIAQPAGAPSSGFQITFADGAALDIHTAIPMSGSVSGAFQPDGRNVDPSVVLDTTPRTTSLSNFIGLNPNGNWTLYVADTATGDQATLTSWTLSVTGTAIPEPTSWIMLSIPLFMMGGMRQRPSSRR